MNDAAPNVLNIIAHFFDQIPGVTMFSIRKKHTLVKETLCNDCQQNFSWAWTYVLARSRLLLRCPPENTVRRLVEDSSAGVSENILEQTLL